MLFYLNSFMPDIRFWGSTLTHRHKKCKNTQLLLAKEQTHAHIIAYSSQVTARLVSDRKSVLFAPVQTLQQHMI